MRLITLLFLSIVTFSTLGCNQNKVTALDRSLQEYNSGQWLLSKMWAEESIENHEDVEQAEYLIGLCEFKRHRLDAAKDWFEKSSHSSNKEVRSKSNAMLGIIALNKGDKETAAIAFEVAAPELDEGDRRQALSRIDSGANRKTYSSNGSFTLQFGAFRNKVNAKQSLNSLTSSLQKIGLGTAWISEDQDDFGKKLYLVQAGRFVSRSSANSRKIVGDLPQCIVVHAP